MNEHRDPPPWQEKETAPPEMPGWTPREAAMHGIWSDQNPRAVGPYRPLYSITD